MREAATGRHAQRFAPIYARLLKILWWIFEAVMLAEGKQLFPAVMSSSVTHDTANCLEKANGALDGRKATP